MLKLAEEMPHTYFSYEHFMVYNWEGNRGFQERQTYMHFLVQELLSMIECLSGHRDDDRNMIHSWEERKEIRQLQLNLLECLYPDGDYQYNAFYGATASYFMFRDSFNKKDYDGAWYWLGRCANYKIHFDTYDFDAPHTSPILRGYSDGGWIMEAEGNHSQSMLNWLTTDDEVAVLRTDPRYEALVNRLKAVARKP